MKLLILSDLHIRHTRGGSIKNNSRGIGAYYVTQKARELGIDATNIDYFLDWPRELLIHSILSFFDDEKECIIGYSGSIDASGTDFYKSLNFISYGNDFFEDGIPHIAMKYVKKN